MSNKDRTYLIVTLIAVGKKSDWYEYYFNAPVEVAVEFIEKYSNLAHVDSNGVARTVRPTVTDKLDEYALPNSELAESISDVLVFTGLASDVVESQSTEELLKSIQRPSEPVAEKPDPDSPVTRAEFDKLLERIDRIEKRAYAGDVYHYQGR